MIYTSEQTALLPNFRYLQTTYQAHVLTITLNRPDKKNALHQPMLQEFAFAISYAHHRPDVWLVVLAATGDTFCAGMDLKQLLADADEEQTVPKPQQPIRLAELLADLGKPCLARVQGNVYAGGFLLLGGCTYVFANLNVTFSLPEVRRGLFPFQVLAQLLELMPARPALDLCLRAKTLTAAEAHALGLVTDLVPADQLDTALTERIDELRQLSPTAMQAGLRAYRQLKHLPPQQHQSFLYNEFLALQQTPDAREGMAAFLEKRKPVWGKE